MVVAFAILGVTLAVLFGALESSLARVRRDTHLSEGTLIAQSLLARAGTEWPLDGGSQKGNWLEYSYSVSEEALSAGPARRSTSLPLVRVVASVFWTEGKTDRQLSLSTLKLLPPVEP
jgi:hypothetical protein